MIIRIFWSVKQSQKATKSQNFKKSCKSQSKVIKENGNRSFLNFLVFRTFPSTESEIKKPRTLFLERRTLNSNCLLHNKINFIPPLNPNCVLIISNVILIKMRRRKIIYQRIFKIMMLSDKFNPQKIPIICQIICQQREKKSYNYVF